MFCKLIGKTETKKPVRVIPLAPLNQEKYEFLRAKLIVRAQQEAERVKKLRQRVEHYEQNGVLVQDVQALKERAVAQFGCDLDSILVELSFRHLIISHDQEENLKLDYVEAVLQFFEN